MGPGDLSRALEPLPSAHDPRILIGRETFDDAGIFRVSDSLALVQTVDFFAPIVDDPYEFGQIAAANALSDVYAMGGEPLTALCICAFPTSTLPLSVLTDILRGGQDKVHEAGAAIVGGHTVFDDEVKFGLSVTGQVHPQHILSNASAQAGDVLVLTKPIGTGLVSTALKSGRIGESAGRAAIESMRTLNDRAARAAREIGARCATDITGFGLLGHASHIARASKVTIRIVASAVPVLEGARDAWEVGASTGGAKRNAEYLEPLVTWVNEDPFLRTLLVDPQTSGGLLIGVPRAKLADYLSRVPHAVPIGEVAPPGERAILVA
jgi:selenide, water dikinase